MTIFSKNWGGSRPLYTPPGYAYGPRTIRSDYISDLAWSCLGVESAELSEIAENRGLFRVLVALLSPKAPQRKSGYESEGIDSVA